MEIGIKVLGDLEPWKSDEEEEEEEVEKQEEWLGEEEEVERFGEGEADG